MPDPITTEIQKTPEIAAVEKPVVENKLPGLEEKAIVKNLEALGEVPKIEPPEKGFETILARESGESQKVQYETLSEEQKDITHIAEQPNAETNISEKDVLKILDNLPNVGELSITEREKRPKMPPFTDRDWDLQREFNTRLDRDYSTKADIAEGITRGERGNAGYEFENIIHYMTVGEKEEVLKLYDKYPTLFKDMLDRRVEAVMIKRRKAIKEWEKEKR